MNILTKLRLADFRLSAPGRFTKMDYVTVVVHVVSFILLSAVVFRINSSALFLRWDGLVHLTEEANQHYWRGPAGILYMDFLKANGELTFPNFYRLNLGFVVARWLGHEELTLWLVSTILATLFFISIIFLGVSLGFRKEIALGGAWLSCLLTLPYFIPTLTYIRLWGNQPFLAGIAPLLVALGLFFRIGSRNSVISTVQTVTAFTLLAYTAATAPFIFAIGVPAVAFFFVVALLTSGDSKELRHKIIGGLVIAIALIPFITFVSELLFYSKVSFFRQELYSLPMTFREVSFFLHPHEEGGPFSALLIVAALSTGLVIAIFSQGKIRRLALGYVLFMACLAGTAWIIANTIGNWWGPPLAYIDMVALPFHCMFLAILLGGMSRIVWWRACTYLPNQYNLTHIMTSQAWKLGISTAMAIPPWISLAVSASIVGTPAFSKHGPWPWPPIETPLVALLKREIGLYDGAPFRGRVVNLAGTQGIYPLSHPPFNNQHAYDHGFIFHVGNDHRNIGFWYFSIPTLNSSTQFTTPFFHLVATRFLNAPHSLSVRQHVALTRYDRRMLENLGVRFVIHESEIGDGAISRGTYAMAGRTLFLYELRDPNLGTYSPTIAHVAKDAKSALMLMAQSQIDFHREAVTHTPLPSNLVPASTDGLRIFRDALHIEATSKGTSLLVLPVEYSHCLVFDLRSPHPQSLKVFRVNLNQTGLLFRDSLSGDIRLRFGVFSNQGCRFKDLKEATQLRLDETVDWWPSQQP